MSDIYEWIGFTVYWGYIALMMSILAHSFMQAASYILLCIVAVFRHERQQQVRWLRVPWEFFAKWRKFTSHGAPDSLSSKYAEWRGIFNWKISPKDTQ